MSRTSNALVALAAATLLTFVACDDGEVAVGSTDQKLQTRNDGTPTGDGKTCSWVDPNTPVSSDGAPDTARTVYNVGDEFPALDGCNECACTTKGIMCTVRSCSGGSDPGNPGQPVACDDSAKICPDGTAVGRTGPNCEWAPCPSAGQECNAQTQCPAGESCYVFPSSPGKAYCSSAPCSACPSTTQCQILESYPAQVRCQ